MAGIAVYDYERKVSNGFVYEDRLRTLWSN